VKEIRYVENGVRVRSRPIKALFSGFLLHVGSFIKRKILSNTVPLVSVHIYDDWRIKNANKFQFSNYELTRGGNMTVTITNREEERRAE